MEERAETEVRAHGPERIRRADLARPPHLGVVRFNGHDPVRSDRIVASKRHEVRSDGRAGHDGAAMNDEALIHRVRKLLAKAESTTNANEAEAFSSKAAALIAAHRLDVRHVRDSLQRGDLGVRSIPIGRGAYVRARLSLLMAVAGHHDCEVVFQTGPTGTTAMVAGFASDLDVTELLYGSLHTQAAGQMAALRRSTPAATQRYRRSFLFGFARRVRRAPRRLAHSRPAAVRGRPAVALRRRPARGRRAGRPGQGLRRRPIGRVVDASPPRPALASGWKDGHRAAGRADLGHRRVSGRRALGPGR